MAIINFITPPQSSFVDQKTILWEQGTILEQQEAILYKPLMKLVEMI